MLARKEILIVHEIDAKRLVEREFNVVLRKQTLEEEMRMFKEFEFFIEGLYEMIFPGAKYRRASRTKVWDFFKKIEYKILTTVYYEHLEAEKCPKSVLESIYKYIVKYKINYRKLIGPDAAKIIDDCRWKFYGNTAKGSEIVARIEVAQRDYAMFGVANTIGEWQRIMMVLMDIHPWGTDRLKFLVDYFGPERQWLLIKILERHGTKPFPANLLDAGSKTARDLINRVRELSPEAAKIKLSDPVSTLGYEVEGIIADWRKNDLKSAWAKWERIVVKVLGMTNGKFDLNLLYKYFFKFDAPGLLVKIFEKFHLGRYPEAAKRNPEIIPLDTKLTSELQNKKQMAKDKREKLHSTIIRGVDECIGLGKLTIKELTPAAQSRFSEIWLKVRQSLKEYCNGDGNIWNLEKLIPGETYKMLHAALDKFQNISEIVKSVKEIIAKWKDKTKDAITEKDKTQFLSKLDTLKKYLKPITGDEDITKLESVLGKETYAILYDILISFGSTLLIPLDDKIASELQNKKKKEQEKREKLRIAIINGVDKCTSLGKKSLKELTPAVQKQFLETWLEVRKNLKEYSNGDDKIWNLEKLIDKENYKILHAA